MARHRGYRGARAGRTQVMLTVAWGAFSVGLLLTLLLTWGVSY